MKQTFTHGLYASSPHLPTVTEVRPCHIKVYNSSIFSENPEPSDWGVGRGSLTCVHIFFFKKVESDVKYISAAH